MPRSSGEGQKIKKKPYKKGKRKIHQFYFKREGMNCQMTKCAELTGQRFGRLVVISRHFPNNREHNTQWLCKCDCGNMIVVSEAALTSKHTQSCGCLQRERAGETHTKHALYYNANGNKSRLYAIWQSMKRRCYNSHDGNYKNYGARGIKVCDEWLNNFKAFHDWAMANGYKDNLTIDRINNDGNYEPSNCRWADKKLQGRNKRNNIILTFDGKTMTLPEWADYLGIKLKVLENRIRRGWSIKRTLTQPVRRSPNYANKANKITA
jgi:hypothetical protein